MSTVAAPAPAAQPEPIPKTPVVTLRFQGPPPPPHPPVTEPTPADEYAQLEAHRIAMQEQKDMAREAEVAAAPPSGALSRFGRIAGAVVHRVEKTASNVHAASEAHVRGMVEKSDRERFQRNFPELVAQGEDIIADYTCKVMSQGLAQPGSLTITARFVCFSGETVKDAIPLTEILSVQRSIALDTIDLGAPFIMPVPAPHVMPDTLQIFTSRQQVFQFFKFESVVSRAGQVLTSTLKGRPIDRCYNWLDHGWRAATPVPVPGVAYADY